MGVKIPKINTEDGLFKNGDPAKGQEGTIVTAEWLNDVQTAVENLENNKLDANDKTKIALSSAVNSNAEDTAATSKAVKTAYDKAVEAQENSESIKVTHSLTGQERDDKKVLSALAGQYLHTKGLENKTAIAVNKTAISVNKTAISVNKTAISVNKTAISVNKTAISVNKTAISQNTEKLNKFQIVNDLGTIDINNVKTIGSYGQRSNAYATAARHYPFPQAGSLHVLPSAYGIQQIYYLFSSNVFFKRNQGSDGTFYPWQRFNGDTNQVKIISGEIGNNATLPLPPGFYESQCTFILSPRTTAFYSAGDSRINHTCYLYRVGRVVKMSATPANTAIPLRASYTVIGVK